MHLKKIHIYISPATKFQNYIQTTCCRFLIRQCNQSYYNVSVVDRKHTEPHRTAQSRSNFTRRIHNEIGLWQCVPCLWFIALLMSLCQSITSSLTQRGVTCNCCITQKDTLTSWKWQFLGVFVDLDNLTWRRDKNVGLCLIKKQQVLESASKRAPGVWRSASTDVRQVPGCAQRGPDWKQNCNRLAVRWRSLSLNQTLSRSTHKTWASFLVIENTCHLDVCRTECFVAFCGSLSV